MTPLREGVSILLIHGAIDPVLPSRCSSNVYGMAKEPKEIIIHDGAGHSLDQLATQVRDEIMTWLLGNLKWAYTHPRLMRP